MNTKLSVEYIESLVLEYAAQEDLFLVELTISKAQVITIIIDSLAGIDIQTCVNLSRFVESKLDREEEDFELTVMSAGLSEPLKVRKQYEKNIGTKVKIITADSQTIIGVIQAVDDEKIQLLTTKIIRTEPKNKKKEVEVIEDVFFDTIKKTTIEIDFK